MVAGLRGHQAGGAGAFLAIASDGNRYWIKTGTGGQGVRVPITEQLVGRAGALIGAPVRPVHLVYVPRAVSGWEFRKNKQLESGFAHASLDLPNSQEERKKLSYRHRDQNSIRHAGFFALYDWCWGDDMQGLVDLDDDNAFHSHDHGYFLPPGGPGWDTASLLANIGTAHELGGDGGGCDTVEVNRICNKLENLTDGDLLSVVGAIPRLWPVSDDELGTVAFYLQERAPDVAHRLRQRFGGTR